MKKLNQINSLVLASLLAAFTCIATMVIQIPTPTFGYIHPGDTLVILCGILLGPVVGGISAGIGSMLADILSGYIVFAVPTLIIKGLSALFCGLTFNALKKCTASQYPAFLAAAFISELNVVFGYFINEVIRTMVLNNSYSSDMLTAGIVSGLGGILLNIIQGIVGIVLSFALFPILRKAIMPSIK